jgi:hypothetical protein
MKIHFLPVLFAVLLISSVGFCQPLNQKETFTHQDTLRGSVGPERSWWDVLHYDITVTPDYNAKTIKGKTTIEYKITQDKHNYYLQVDLQKPLIIDTIFYNNKLYINYPPKP